MISNFQPKMFRNYQVSAHSYILYLLIPTPCTCNADSEVCVNLDGNFECACNAGYEAIGETCQDLDECAAGLDNCEADEVCVNTPGSFTCMSHQMNSCELGHVWVGTPTEGACEDQDECATDNGGCFNAECENKIGSFECHCNTGFIDINGVCSDIDECSGDVCQFEGSMDCVNTLGSYQCTCQNGFKQNDDLLTCSDIDECADARIRTGCAENGEVCHNLPGGFECVAPLMGKMLIVVCGSFLLDLVWLDALVQQ